MPGQKTNLHVTGKIYLHVSNIVLTKSFPEFHISCVNVKATYHQNLAKEFLYMYGDRNENASLVWTLTLKN